MLKKAKRKGIFISFEGLEGSGKSSVINFLRRYLRRQGYKVLVLREPGSTKIGEKIRRILLDKRNKKISPHTELLLYLAARTQLIEERLKKSLREYDFVISDRFFDSTLVYQGYALGLGKVVDKAVAMFSLGIEPDLTIILDTDVKKSLARLGRRDRIESRPFSFHCRLQEGYRRLVRKYPHRIKLLSAEKSLAEVYDDVKDVISPLLTGKAKRLKRKYRK